MVTTGFAMLLSRLRQVFRASSFMVFVSHLITEDTGYDHNFYGSMLHFEAEDNILVVLERKKWRTFRYAMEFDI